MLRKFYILSLVAMLIACSKQGEVIPESEDPTAISFGASDSSSRAATLIGGADVEAFRAEPFSVYGDWIDQDGTRREATLPTKMLLQVGFTTLFGIGRCWVVTSFELIGQHRRLCWVQLQRRHWRWSTICCSVTMI